MAKAKKAGTLQAQTCPVEACPVAGDVFVCAEGCGFTLTVNRDCSCDEETAVGLACCGFAMNKVN